MAFKSLIKSSDIETSVMAVVLIASYLALGVVSFVSERPSEGMSALNIFALMLGFFVLSFIISVVAAITGIGGGIFFTPVMLAFTPVDSLIIRSTGLIIAMFTGLAATGPVMKRGLGNLRMCVLLAGSYGAGAFMGAHGAIYIWKYMGEGGEAIIRIALGVVVSAAASFLLFGGKRVEWPEVRSVDRLTEWLKLPQPYYEQSLRKVVVYRLSRAWQGIIAVGLIGLVSGFFGLGAGWAIVPAQNLILGAPLKVAAANSLVLLGMGDCMAIWPYFLTGAVIPLFAAPWLAGVVFGSKVGSALLIKVRAGFIRIFLIGILYFTGFSLAARGLDMAGVVRMQGWINALVFMIIIVMVFRAAVFDGKARGDSNEEK